MTHRVTICRSCRMGQDGLALALARALEAAGLACLVAETECMSGCTRPATLAFRAPGKTAYLFGDISRDDLPDLVTFARLYLDAPDGNLPDARPLGALRLKAMARIPG
jgi:predicted metal-binding protein